MDNALYVGLSRQMVLRQQMDIVANNIANANTTGFKLESLMEKTNPQAKASTVGSSGPVQFVSADGVARDFSQGSMSRTDTPLDVAIEGQGYFTVNTANGPRYTRDGHFRLDDTGRLVTQSGDTVADDGGGEITLDPQQGMITIAPDGTVSQGTQRVAKLGVVSFPTPSALQKAGDNLFQNTSNQQPAAAADTVKVRQGMLEGSNVQPIVEITRMIEVNRAYEQITKMMDATADLSKTAVERMGKVQ
jgi:flagellar basal-body rod protein FlgF